MEPMTTDAATVRAPMITSVLTPASPGVGTPMKAAPPDLGAENPLPRATPLTSGGFWLQLGVFRQRDGAADFRRRVAGELDWLAPLLAIFQDRSVHRLQAGPYTTHSEAKSAAERIRNSLRLVPVIVERR